MNRAEDEGLETSLDMDWVASLEKRLASTKFKERDTEPTIYRVLDILKKVDPEAYEPLLVSLGPYHRDKPHLQAMNRIKWKCLKFVLDQNPSVALEDYLDRITKLETRARDAYSEEVKMSSNSFVEMMLLDGCFVMITIMRHNLKMNISEERTLWNRFEVIPDIFMLENQLPFFLLETLYESAFPLGAPFRNLAFEYIRRIFTSNFELPSDTETFHHMIHLFLSCIDPKRNHGNSDGNGNQFSIFGFLCRSKLVKTIASLPPKLCSSLLSQMNKICSVRDANPTKSVDFNVYDWIPNATVLNEAGIHFERKKRAKSFLDITFRNGIPQLQIDDNTNSLLRNFIAYEQFSMGSKSHVSSYMQLMDCLIDSAADVEVLQQDDIIISGLGDNQEVATLINKLGMHVTMMEDFYLVDVVNAMKKHHNTRYNKWRARLNRDYFGNPWAVITLFGALLLFALTVIPQTIYTILSYVRSQN
ncbi:UPF0481 protein At3g47200-like [Curcuma longa]|uniref:UPF0481 protein At3g47200-like n=1 Tax=Curcuma longa TaxID=136217 RepID=UPI003D9F68D8